MPYYIFMYLNIQDGMNIVDVLAIMPYYVSLFLITEDLSPGKKDQGREGSKTDLFLKELL